MFGLFQSQEKKMRENATNWLEVADRVYHFRRDILAAPLVGELQAHIATLRALLKDKVGAEKLRLEIEALEEVLRRTGGAIYPKSALVENVDFNKWICGRTPAGRWGKPEELAGAAVFLASPASDFVNGQILYVDGGLLAAL
jgi:hypothetical protein